VVCIIQPVDVCMYVCPVITYCVSVLSLCLTDLFGHDNAHE